jgi:hypothetical protein
LAVLPVSGIMACQSMSEEKARPKAPTLVGVGPQGAAVVVGAVGRVERSPGQVAEETQRMIFEPATKPEGTRGAQLSFSSEVDQSWPDEPPPPSEEMPAAEAAKLAEGEPDEASAGEASAEPPREVPGVAARFDAIEPPTEPATPAKKDAASAKAAPAARDASPAKAAAEPAKTEARAARAAAPAEHFASEPPTVPVAEPAPHPLPTAALRPSGPEEPTPPPAARSAPDAEPPAPAPRKRSARWLAATALVVAAAAVAAVKVPSVRRLLHPVASTSTPTSNATPTPAAASAPIPAAASAPAESASAAPEAPVTSAPSSSPEVAPHPFDSHAAKQALDATAKAVAKCRRGRVFGAARAIVTFANDGAVKNTAVSPPFMGTAAGACVAEALAEAHVAPFIGKPGIVTHRFVVDR